VIAQAERERIRALAEAEVARNAPPPHPGQLAAVAAIMGPAVREAQAALEQGGTRAARGAA
jgi:hypothetical protein